MPCGNFSARPVRSLPHLERSGEFHEAAFAMGREITHHSGQAGQGIIAQRGDGFQRHVSAALDGAFIFLLEQQRRRMASSLGKIPTTSVRRFASSRLGSGSAVGPRQGRSDRSELV